MEKAIRIKIKSVQYNIDGMGGELFFSDEGAHRKSKKEDISELCGKPPKKNDAPESNTIELESDGVMNIKDGRLEVSYEETELTGMAGSITAVSFEESAPELVTMIREGSVNTVLVFEENKRNICAYETEYMPFEICIHTYKVENCLTRDGGTLSLDYVIEIHGSAAERTKFTLEVRAI